MLGVHEFSGYLYSLRFKVYSDEVTRGVVLLSKKQAFLSFTL